VFKLALSPPSEIRGHLPPYLQATERGSEVQILIQWINRLTDADISVEQIREKGMKEMSRKYEEMGSELYLSKSGEKREPID